MITPQRYCTASPDCRHLVTSDRPCPVHGTLRRPSDAWRGSNRQRGYTYRWEQRAKAFRDRYPLCGMRPGNVPPVMSRCHDEHRVTPGAQVDHVVPHRNDPVLFWDELHNWQTLCAACGSRKSQAGL